MATAKGPAPDLGAGFRAAEELLRDAFFPRFCAPAERVRPPAVRSALGRRAVDFRARAVEVVRVAIPAGYPDNHFGHTRHTPNPTAKARATIGPKTTLPHPFGNLTAT
jgi:hypothetical protein